MDYGREQLNSALFNLNLALQDEALESQQKTIEFYWDTSDVRNALLGQAAFYQSEFLDKGKRNDTFHAHLFNDDRCLVHCLQAAGWFGPIKMLQPHQAELYKLINQGFSGAIDVPFGGASKFFTDVGLKGLENVTAEELDRMSTDRMAKIVAQQAGSAATLFKVVQSLKYHNWKSRLSAWHRQGQIELERQQYDYGVLANTAEFELLRCEFEKERPTLRTNNFADAMALCQLLKKVEDYEQRRTDKVPRFFSTPLYNQILKRTKLLRRFEYTYDGGKYPVFRCSDYYKLRATLRQSQDGVAFDSKAIESLQSTRQRLEEIQRAQEPLKEDILKILNDLVVGPHTVHSILKKLREYWFLEAVWLPVAATAEMMDALKGHLEVARKLAHDPAFRNALNQQVNLAQDELKEETKEFQKVSHLWRDLEHVTIKIASESQETNLFKKSGLLRFGFSAEIEKDINCILSDLASHEPAVRDAALMSLFKKYQAVASGTASLQDLCVVCGAMWALELDLWVSNVLDSSSITHPPLLVLLGAIGFRRKPPEIGLGEQMIKRAEEAYADTDNDQAKVELAIGLGYLHFHLFESIIGHRIRLSGNQARDIVQKAAKYAQQAMFVTGDDVRKKVYATNQFLFYALQAGNSFEWSEIVQAASALSDFETDVELWQYRYDDTLAHFFEEQAKRETNLKDRRRAMDTAIERMDKAVEAGGAGDDYVLRHRERLILARQTLRSKS